MIRVATAARLHFGLLSLPSPGERWPHRDGAAILPARWFGGVGLMVERPGIILNAEPADAWSAVGPLAERALGYARRLASSFETQPPYPPQHLVIEHGAPEHVGLGTGTQLALAVARAVTASWGLTLPATQLAPRVGRGLRSALGVHGFEQGGLLVDAGKRSSDGIAPLAVALEFPKSWPILLARPRSETASAAGLHGKTEQDAFAALARQGSGLRQTEALCRLVLLGLLPTVVEEDFPAFAEALFDFNARAGEVFAPVQGGVYAGPAVTELVALLRSRGARGVGQSSWGPTVFAVCADAEQANDLARYVHTQLGEERVETVVTRAENHGAMVVRQS